MELILEVQYPGKTATERHMLETGVYAVGNAAASDKGKPIRIKSQFVNKDHALIESTRSGWKLTALQPQIKSRGKNNEILKISESKRIGVRSRFIIGNVELRFLTPEKTSQDTPVEDTLQLSSLNLLESELHIRLTKETQLLTRIERPDTEDKEYIGKVQETLFKLANDAVNKASNDDLQVFAADASKRDIIYRIIGGAGLFDRDDVGRKLSEAEKLDFNKIQRTMSDELGLSREIDDAVSDLEIVNARYEQVFEAEAKNFSTNLLKKLVRQTLIQSINDIVFGIGPLEPLQQNEAISEIMVVRSDKIFVELNGNLVETGLTFVDERSSQTITSYIVGQVGKQINVQNPYEDARLSDGSRVNAVVSPVALDGAALTVRKFSANPLTLDDLLRFGAVSRAMASFLEGCVVSKRNIVVSGGTGTGKTTMVNWLGSMIPPKERLVTAEDVAELRLELPHVVRLEARPESSDGEGEITIRDLVRNALRMRPDRIIIGECRGGEAFDMLQAMNTGHEGSLTTLHANNAEESISRLENLVLQADQGLPIDAIRYQIAGAIDYVVQLKRYPNGKRKISEIAEVGGIDPITKRVEVNPIFETLYDHTKKDAEAIFSFAGRTPEAIDDIIKAGFDPSLLSF